MKLRRMRELAEELGISRHTFMKWIKADPTLAEYRAGGPGGGAWWIKLDRLAGRHGLTLHDAYMLGSSRWVAAAALATRSGLSRRTIADWCRKNPTFAKRLGHKYYIDVDELGADPRRLATLLGKPGKDEDEEE